jgi:hypothetical protein
MARRLYRFYRHIFFRPNAFWVWWLYLKHELRK